jgi:Mycothiol maleylpyruvate isomerase N-terminal domain
MTVRDVFGAAAGYAVGLLGEPAVARRWDDPSALAEMSVGALAGHLARQILNVQLALAEPRTAQPPIPLVSHYQRSGWVNAGLQDEPNVLVRETSAREAADGPDALAARAAADVAVSLLARLALGRHGSAAILRALCRAERAPASITAF